MLGKAGVRALFAAEEWAEGSNGLLGGLALFGAELFSCLTADVAESCEVGALDVAAGVLLLLSFLLLLRDSPPSFVLLLFTGEVARDEG